MAQTLHALRRPIALFVVGLLLSACNDGGGTTPDPECNLTLALTPSSAEVEVGQSAQLQSAISQTGCTGVQTTWTSSNAAVATVGGSGLVTGVSPGTSTVEARIEANGIAATAASGISVLRASVASLQLSPDNATLIVGETQDLAARLEDAAGNQLDGREIAWASQNTSVATVSQTGRVNAVGPGATMVTATSEGRTGSAAITVNPPPVTSVVVSPSTKSIQVGEQTGLSAETRGAGGQLLTDRPVSWSSTNETVAAVSSSGVVTAVAPGSSTISAISEGVSGSASVTVVAATIPVASVTLAPATVSVEEGEEIALAVETRGPGGELLTGRPVAWSSNSTGVATVSAFGLVTAVAPGNATITATSEGISGTASVTVSATVVPVTSVVVTPATLSIEEGQQASLGAETRGPSGELLSEREVVWTTGDAGVATVSAAGVVTAVGVGSVTIAATSEGVSGTASVGVTSSGSLEVGVGPLRMGFVGQTVRLRPLRLDGDGDVVSPATFGYSSGAPGVASVASDGTITALASGDATITVTSGTLTKEVDVQVDVVFDNIATFEGNTYGRTGFLNWDAAAALARRYGGRLVVIGSEAEDDFVTSTYTPEGGFRRNIWIGLRRVGGVLEWVNEAPVTYTDFGSGQPEGDGDCIHYWQSTTGQWNDIDCNLEFEAVVEFSNDFPVTFQSAWMHEGGFYLRTANRFDWVGARRMAAAMGGRLIVIEDRAEMDAVVANARGGWIGLRDRRAEGIFEWLAGGAPVFTWWAPGRPQFDEARNCVRVVPSLGSRWEDDRCTRAFVAIIEFRD